jgi:hypothetical protein
MKNIWYNIKNDNSIVQSQEIIFNKEILLNKFRNMFTYSEEYSFLKWKYTTSAPYHCIIEYNNKKIDVMLYLKNITNAGWEHKPDVKRVQVSNPKYLNLNFNRVDDMEKISLIIGYYNFEKPIFVSWDAYEFRRHKTNRSCYVDIESLVAGYSEGYYKTKLYNQDIEIFSSKNIDIFLNNFFDKTKNDMVNILDSLYEITMDYYNMLKQFEEIWIGKDKVLELKDSNSPNWKQIEWPGFYFEFVMQELAKEDRFFKVSYGNTTFDLFDNIPWDLKVHSQNSKSKNKIITNDYESISKSIGEFGYQGFMILEGDSVYEENGEFRNWHNEIKGGKSTYQLKNEKLHKPHRKRKKAFIPKNFIAIVLDKDELMNHSKFQKGFVNSNGKPRKEKLILDLNKINKKNILLNKKIKH